MKTETLAFLIGGTICASATVVLAIMLDSFSPEPIFGAIPWWVSTLALTAFFVCGGLEMRAKYLKELTE